MSSSSNRGSPSSSIMTKSCTSPLLTPPPSPSRVSQEFHFSVISVKVNMMVVHIGGAAAVREWCGSGSGDAEYQEH